MNIQDIRQGIRTLVELKLSRGTGNLPKAPIPVRLHRVNRQLIVTLLDGIVSYAAEPAGENHRYLLDRLLKDNLPRLVVLLDCNKDGMAAVQIQSFADEKPMDLSIGFDDLFANKAKRHLKLDTGSSWTQQLDEMFVIDLLGLKHAVLGIHIEDDKKDRFNSFLLAGADRFVQIKRHVDDDGNVTFMVDRMTERIDETEYVFSLIKGDVGFADSTSVAIARQQTLAIMAEKNNSIDSYLNTWKSYGEIEERQMYEKAKQRGVLRYQHWDYAGRGRIRLSVNNLDRLTSFQKSFDRDLTIMVCEGDPSELFENELSADRLKDFLKQEETKLSFKIEPRDIHPGEGWISITASQIPDNKQLPSSGHMFMSLFGDIERFKRREEARDAILSVRNPMPKLAAILEGSNVSTPLPQYHEPISPAVKAEIFPDNDPTPTQARAIEIAINTPDIAIIQGPPGTGKTTVIRAILKRLNEIGDSSDVLFGQNLVTAYQHDAVQNAIERIEVFGMPAIKIGDKSGSADNAQVVERMVENWINDHLTQLYNRYPDLVKNDYMSRFDDLYNNYLYSSNTVESTLALLQAVHGLLSDKLDAELLVELNRLVSELRMTAPDKQEPERRYLIASIRRIPVTSIAYSDNGKETIREAIYRLKQEKISDLDAEVQTLERILNLQELDAATYATLRAAQKRLLAGLIPEENIFHTPKQKEEILQLFARISDHLRTEFNKTKFGEDAVVLQYISEYVNSPLAVRNAMLQYMSVIGVTNQQVVGKKAVSLKGGNNVYENVLVDEAARSNPLDLFIPLSLARDRIILVGDHRQLPHLVEESIIEEIEKTAESEGNASSKERASQNIEVSLFENLRNVLRKMEQKDGIRRTITLDKQYRMHHVLGEFVSRNFYERHQEVSIDSPLPPEKFAHRLPELENKACVWYDVPYSPSTAETSTRSKSRPYEAKQIARHLKKLMDSEAAKGLTFGIIAYYREQLKPLYEALVEVGIAEKSDDEDRFEIAPRYRDETVKGKKIEKLRIGTVDSFQGMEFDVVYLSVVRSNTLPALSKRQKDKKYGHLMVENRLCVSMSRQKKLLIVFGDSSMLQGPDAEKAIPALVNYYSLCQGDQTYGKVI